MTGCAPRHRSAWAESRGRRHAMVRSEEHTSELQSRRDLVCRLLLEKKKKKKNKESRKQRKEDQNGMKNRKREEDEVHARGGGQSAESRVKTDNGRGSRGRVRNHGR